MALDTIAASSVACGLGLGLGLSCRLSRQLLVSFQRVVDLLHYLPPGLPTAERPRSAIGPGPGPLFLADDSTSAAATGSSASWVCAIHGAEICGPKEDLLVANTHWESLSTLWAENAALLAVEVCTTLQPR